MAQAWYDLINQYAQPLRLEILSYCEDLNEKPEPRYYHADVIDRDNPLGLAGDKVTWRLKVVNRFRDDRDAIRACNYYNNCVHARLARASALSAVLLIPKYFHVPRQYLRDLSCSQLIQGRSLTIGDSKTIIDTLVNLHSNCKPIAQELRRQSRSTSALIGHEDELGPINERGREEYKKLLQSSLVGLVDRGRIDHKDERKVLSEFEEQFPMPVLYHEQSFVHGDFSFGNIKFQGEHIAMFDFEHSHLGLGCLDLAHLFVNLLASGQEDAAKHLSSEYQARAKGHSVPFNDQIFRALILERAAGKLNAMAKLGEPGERLRALLLAC